MSPASRFAFADILHVLDALPVGVLMVSPEGRVLHINSRLSALTGFSAASAGMPCRHVLRGRPCVAGCPLGCSAFGGGRAEEPGGITLESLSSDGFPRLGGRIPGSIESDILTLKKRRVPVRLTHFPVLDAEGSELFRLDVAEDLTELKSLETRLRQASGHGKLIGRSAAMEKISALIPSVASSSAPVFLSGETGTGKDVLAEALHQASQRSREPFIRLNPGPLPEELLAPEIFGQAAPDAPERPGRFQQAAGGTLYIAEIADIPKGMQARLIQFLDTGAVLPVGALRESRPDVRLITATNHDPAALVRQGTLSGELFHRLNVVHLALPPLRERREDIDFLLRHFLEIYGQRFKKRFRGFSAQARSLLAAYDYPGNVRELRNIVEYAAMVCAGEEIDRRSLPAHVAQTCGRTSFAGEGPGRKAGKRARRGS